MEGLKRSFEAVVAGGTRGSVPSVESTPGSFEVLNAALVTRPLRERRRLGAVAEATGTRGGEVWWLSSRVGPPGSAESATAPSRDARKADRGETGEASAGNGSRPHREIHRAGAAREGPRITECEAHRAEGIVVERQ